MNHETYKAYTKLGEEAQSIEDLVTLREMATADEGGTTEIKVSDENGNEQIIPVTKIGAGTLAALEHTPIELAQPSTSWQDKED